MTLDGIATGGLSLWAAVSFRGQGTLRHGWMDYDSLKSHKIHWLKVSQTLVLTQGMPRGTKQGYLSEAKPQLCWLPRPMFCGFHFAIRKWQWKQWNFMKTSAWKPSFELAIQHPIQEFWFKIKSWALTVTSWYFMIMILHASSQHWLEDLQKTWNFLLIPWSFVELK